MIVNSPEWSRHASRLMRKLGFSVLIGYWVVAGLLGTLFMANYIVMTHAPNMERIVFATLAQRLIADGGTVSLCVGVCFNDGPVPYQGFRMLIIIHQGAMQ